MGMSAFGVDDNRLSKADDRRRNTAIAGGAGAVAGGAGAGYAAGRAVNRSPAVAAARQTARSHDTGAWVHANAAASERRGQKTYMTRAVNERSKLRGPDARGDFKTAVEYGQRADAWDKKMTEHAQSGHRLRRGARLRVIQGGARGAVLGAALGGGAAGGAAWAAGRKKR